MNGGVGKKFDSQPPSIVSVEQVRGFWRIIRGNSAASSKLGPFSILFIFYPAQLPLLIPLLSHLRVSCWKWPALFAITSPQQQQQQQQLKRQAVRDQQLSAQLLAWCVLFRKRWEIWPLQQQGLVALPDFMPPFTWPNILELKTSSIQDSMKLRNVNPLILMV